MGELGTLQLNANGAVIGRPRRCDSGCSSMPRRHADHPDSSRYINAAHVAKHREKADTSRSRDYTGLKPEAVITSAIDVRSDTFNRDESRRRSTSDVIDRSRDKQHPLPFGRGDTTRRQPEAVCAGRQRSRQCGRSADGKDIRLRTGRHHRRGTDDAGGTDVVRATNDCHKQRHRRNYNHAEIDHITRSTVNVALAALQPRATTSKTELRHKGVTSKVEGRTSHHHHQFRAAPQARYESAARIMATSKQIWWPCQASTDEEPSKTNVDVGGHGHRHEKETGINGACAAAAGSEVDAAKVAAGSWNDVDASVEESIRELDKVLLQQDLDPL